MKPLATAQRPDQSVGGGGGAGGGGGESGDWQDHSIKGSHRETVKRPTISILPECPVDSDGRCEQKIPHHNLTTTEPVSEMDSRVYNSGGYSVGKDKR